MEIKIVKTSSTHTIRRVAKFNKKQARKAMAGKKNIMAKIIVSDRPHLFLNNDGVTS